MNSTIETKGTAPSGPQAAARQQRQVAGLALADETATLTRASMALAQRFRQGGMLIAFGNGGGSSDAQHIAVEFVHPVIAGKRALPAISLTNDAATLSGLAVREGWDDVFVRQLQCLARPQDVALGISADGRCQNVLRGFAAAKEMGLLTIALIGGEPGPLARSSAVDHLFVVRAEDPRVVKEMHVAVYHILWELTHVFFEQHDALDAEAAMKPAPDERRQTSALQSLYPFLYAAQTDSAALLEQIQRSTREKILEIAALRDQVERQLSSQLRACAQTMARLFLAHGRLFVFGNGGSAADAQAVTQLFFHPPSGRALPACSLANDTAVITAFSNDVSFAVAFARQIAAFGGPGDIAMGFSTSGNSDNVLHAFAEAARRGLFTVGFAGYDGGKMAETEAIQSLFVVPASSVHRIQEAQITLAHLLWELTQEAFSECPGEERRP